jgi:tetratricopeptide (TPR) repeat protein
MFQRRQYEAAMQAFTAALRFAPLPEIYYNMAVTAERLRSYRDAYDYYRDYLRLRPESPDRASIERRMEELRGQRNQ